jgi:hypothetical protein
MAWPGSTISTNNLDDASDKPANARADLLSAVQAVNDIVDSRGVANGVASLDGSGHVPDAQIPDTISSDSGNDITLTPDSERVTIFYIASLQPRSVAQLANVTAISGDVSYCSNGDSGNACVAVYTVNAWKRIAFGANISAS